MASESEVYLDGVLALGGGATGTSLVWYSNFRGPELGTYAVVTAIGIVLAALFVRQWIHEWWRAGETLAE